MWQLESTEIKNYIFYYKTGTFEELKHDAGATCEDICKELCRRWKFPPLVQLLFGLRVHGKQIWVAGSRQLIENEHYEFRIRIKIPKLSDLNQLDKNTYDYFYHQVRYDVLHSAIPEIEYPKYKDDILGLCVVDMYIEMIENNRSVDFLQQNFKCYIPKELEKKYSFMGFSFIENKIVKKLKCIEAQKKEHDAFYVKSVYLQKIDLIAPNYLTEEYWGTTSYPKDDNLKNGTCRVRVQIAPYHPEEPGLRIHYRYKNMWKHISTFGDFYTVQIDNDTNQVNLEIQNSPLGFPITMDNVEEIESFVSCINLYYRLMIKWNMDLCSLLSSPSLKFLTDNKIHGHIGGSYSYSKIEEKSSSVGTFIIRQCEKVFDTFYIDIVTKENQTETHKILYNSTTKKWRMFGKEDDEQEFTDLIDLAKSIPTENEKYFRMHPTQHDKSPLLLLCQTMKPLPIAATTGLKGTNPIILRAAEDLLLYKWEQRDFGDGVFTRMKADYIQPNGRKKTEVTLKILKQNEVERRLNDFLKLSDKWSKLDLSEIVRMHGMTLQQPISLVLESINIGPLDEFLRTHKYRKNITLLNLVETAYSLAKALHYLQENQIVHGRIRCATLEVTQFGLDRDFVVKLGDPGLLLEYTVNDVPWIPIEDYHNLNGCRNNLKADIWAYATTLWEIFSRGASPLSSIQMTDPIDFFSNGERLQKPIECATLPGIYELMKSGWDIDPERRFSPQKIFSRLVDAKTALTRNYSHIGNGPNTSTYNNNSELSVPRANGNLRKIGNSRTIDYHNSIISAETDQTYISSLHPSTGTTTAYIENCGSSINSNGGSSQVSLLNGNSSNGSQMTMNAFLMDDFDGYLAPGVLEFDDGNTKLIFQGEIGRGFYGLVYRGTMESFNQEETVETSVAIKCFKSFESNSQFKDFLREAKIMKTLQHENIVKIYEFYEDPLLIIMEYMSGGSLLTYLSIHRPDLNVEDILHFALDIAKGMYYLEKMNIVHRDLAARNVLVASNNCVKITDTKCKIADFGLAQFTNQNGYYEYSTNNRALPLKWYAPETIERPKFSSKSDVWSYGITLFEMFSFGESPDLIQNQIDVRGEEILTALKDGQRLRCPKFCPPNVYEELMMICWNYNSEQRPTFAELLDKVENLLISNGESV